MIIAALLFATATQQIDYRFDQVKRTVKLNDAQVATGKVAQSGDKVETGWFSYAMLASDHYKAKFEIFSSTNVKLAGGQPGIILTLDRGKLHAIFDKITGDEPRVVQTPGALLAVRGTQYDVEVDKDGRTDLKVFEGTVEVRWQTKPEEPVFVHAGEMTSFGRQDPPQVHPMPDRGPNGAQRGDNGSHDGHDHGGMQPGGGMQPPQGGHGGMQPPQPGQQPPPQPGMKPPDHH
jgi:FecR-like protein